MTVAVFDKQARVVYPPSLENSGVSSWTRGEDTSDVLEVALPGKTTNCGASSWHISLGQLSWLTQVTDLVGS